jgi:chromodomain-helicase-DNA-binding protein 7
MDECCCGYQAEEEAAFASEDIDQILTARTEKRQIGSRAGNTFSVATFAAAEEERGNDQDYWAALLPDAVASHEEAAKVVCFYLFVCCMCV